MKIGSLVECVNDNFYTSLTLDLHKTLPIKGKIYTIRLIFDGKPYGTGVLLEEITRKINQIHNTEQGFNINRFREVLPPTSISIENILEKELTNTSNQKHV